jgi:hypothetical protein
MSTIRQIQANQQNAQLSTGPRSTEGKTVVSRNALRSGIDANSMLIHDESSADFDMLQTEYFDRWLPNTPEQRALVDSLVEFEWLIRRYRRLETHLWQDSMPDESQFRSDIYLSQAFTGGSRAFDRLTRHRNSAQRNYHSVLRDLERLKKEELTAAPPAPEPLNITPIDPLPPQLIHLEPTSQPFGFVPPMASAPCRLPSDSPRSATP